MTFIPTYKQFREARLKLGLTQMQVHLETGIPQTAISNIENSKHVGKPYYEPFGPSYRERLRKFYTSNGLAFPIDNAPPVPIDKTVFISDLKEDFEKPRMQKTMWHLNFRQKSKPTQHPVQLKHAGRSDLQNAPTVTALPPMSLPGSTRQPRKTSPHVALGHRVKPGDDNWGVAPWARFAGLRSKGAKLGNHTAAAPLHGLVPPKKGSARYAPLKSDP